MGLPRLSVLQSRRRLPSPKASKGEASPGSPVDAGGEQHTEALLSARPTGGVESAELDQSTSVAEQPPETEALSEALDVTSVGQDRDRFLRPPSTAPAILTGAA